MEQTITIPALGKVAAFGDMYDATRNCFVDEKVLRGIRFQKISRINTPSYETKFSYVSRKSNTAKALGIHGEMRLSFLLSQQQNEEPKSGFLLSLQHNEPGSIACIYIERKTTEFESINWQDNKDDFDFHEMVCATHMVVGIQYGLTSITSLSCKADERYTSRELEKCLKEELKKHIYAADEKHGRNKRTLTIHRDVQSSPQTAFVLVPLKTILNYLGETHVVKTYLPLDKHITLLIEHFINECEEISEQFNERLSKLEENKKFFTEFQQQRWIMEKKMFICRQENAFFVINEITVFLKNGNNQAFLNKFNSLKEHSIAVVFDLVNRFYISQKMYDIQKRNEKNADLKIAMAQCEDLPTKTLEVQNSKQDFDFIENLSNDFIDELRSFKELFVSSTNKIIQKSIFFNVADKYYVTRISNSLMMHKLKETKKKLNICIYSTDNYAVNFNLFSDFIHESKSNGPPAEIQYVLIDADIREIETLIKEELNLENLPEYPLYYYENGNYRKKSNGIWTALLNWNLLEVLE